MSSMDEPTLEFFVQDSFMRITPEQEARIVEILEPYRESIEYSMAEDYDPSTMSWRDYRNAMWSTYSDKRPQIDAVLET